MAVLDPFMDLACSLTWIVHEMPFSKVSPKLLAALSINIFEDFFGKFFVCAIEEVFWFFISCFAFTPFWFLPFTGFFCVTDNLCHATFFKVEWNCKLEDVGSVVVLLL